MNTCGTRGFCCRGADDCDCDPDSTRYFTLEPVTLVAESATALASPTSMSGTISAVATTSAPVVSSNTSESDSESRSNQKAVGLGTGLGIGIPLTIAVIGGLWLLYRRQNQRRMSLDHELITKSHAAQPSSSARDSESLPPGDQKLHELSPAVRAEMYATGFGEQPAELPSTGERRVIGGGEPNGITR